MEYSDKCYENEKDFYEFALGGKKMNEKNNMSEIQCEIRNIEKAIKVKLDSLPWIHREVLELRYGLPRGKTHSLEETAERIGIDIESVEELEAEVLRMIRKPKRMILNEDKHIELGLLETYDNAVEWIEERHKFIFGEPFYCLRKSKDEEKFRAFLLAKNRTGVRNIKKCLSVLEYEPCCWDYVTTHREGILIGQRCDWRYIQNLVLGNYNDEEIKSMLADWYRDADYVEIPEKSCMYQIRGEEQKRKPGADEYRKMQKMAGKIVRYLTEMGKVVMADLNTCNVNEKMLYDYEYLGDQLAEEVVLKNPHLIEDQITHFICFQIEQ